MLKLKCCGASSGPVDWLSSKTFNEEAKIELSISSPTKSYKLPASCCSSDYSKVICDGSRKSEAAAPYSDVIYSQVSCVCVCVFFLMEILKVAYFLVD